MDKQQKKQMLSAWKAQQKGVARDALPMRDKSLAELFETLDRALEFRECDHTRKLTQSWLEENGQDLPSVTSWLDETGGYCDCEVLANSAANWRYATGRE